MNEVAKKYRDYLTVGRFLEIIKEKNIPMDSKILIQRIEDVYFEKHNWDTIKRKGEQWHQLNNRNNDIDSGKFLDKEEYPHIIPEIHLVKSSEKELEESMDEYHPAWYAATYLDEDDNIYLDAHY